MTNYYFTINPLLENVKYNASYFSTCDLLFTTPTDFELRGAQNLCLAKGSLGESVKWGEGEFVLRGTPGALPLHKKYPL